MRALLLLPLLCTVGCVGTAGGELFEFSAFAAGPENAAGQSYAFSQPSFGYDIVLTRARLHVGAIYLNRAVPLSGAGAEPCVLPGIYSAEVTTGFDVDVLSPTLQPFPARGFATTDRAFTGEVWLTGGDVNDDSDPTLILDLAGTASKAETVFPFEAKLTISNNRVVPPPNPALPGGKPICKERIVSNILVDLTPEPGQSLRLRIDPAGFFTNVDFSTLGDPSADGIYRFEDERGANPASKNLYDGIHHNSGVYSFSWQ
jgi:hypothetical protein